MSAGPGALLPTPRALEPAFRQTKQALDREENLLSEPMFASLETGSPEKSVFAGQPPSIARGGLQQFAEPPPAGT
jgi:hypothetical protein